MTVRDKQMVRDQKKFENHWSNDTAQGCQNQTYILRGVQGVSTTQKIQRRGHAKSGIAKITFYEIADIQFLYKNLSKSLHVTGTGSKLSFNQHWNQTYFSRCKKIEMQIFSDMRGPGA